MKTTKKQLKIYANALIKAVCESKLNCKVEFTKSFITLWVYGDDDIAFTLNIYVRAFTRKENHDIFKQMIKYLKDNK